MQYHADPRWFPPIETPVASARELLDRFVTPSASLLRSRELLTRTDTKFALPSGRLERVLEMLTRHYAALRVESGPIATYDSRYFDTPSLTCFHDHRRGRRPRHKIRIRHYPDRQLSYLEIKTKRNEAVTDKQRLSIPYGCDALSSPTIEFLRAHIGDTASLLQPTIDVRFRRLSLLGLETNERVTIDVAIEAPDHADVGTRLARLAVVEVKQSPFCVRTPVMRALHQHGVRPLRVSKYIATMAIAHPDLAVNRLRPNLRDIERLNQRG
jgi:hypothetical protein